MLCVGVDDLQWTKAFRVTWPADDVLELAPGLTLHRTGGHFDGHTVLHDARRGVLFCGDSLKVDLDADGAPSACRRTRRSTRRSRCRTASCGEYRAVVERAGVRRRRHAVRVRRAGVTTEHVAGAWSTGCCPGRRTPGPIPLAELVMSAPPTRYLASLPARRGRRVPGRGAGRRSTSPLHSAALPTTARPPGRQRARLRRDAARRRAPARSARWPRWRCRRARWRAASASQASYAELVRTQGAGRVQDPRTLCLEAGSAYDDDRVAAVAADDAAARRRGGAGARRAGRVARRATCRAPRRRAAGSRP